MDLLELDRTAIDRTTALVAALDPEHYDLPTPCAGWTVRDVVRHLVDMAIQYDAGARDGKPRARISDDLVAAYMAAGDLVTGSFRAEGFLDRDALLPGFGTHPGRNLVGAHLVDTVVHSWDLARALGRDGVVEDDLALVAYQVARRYPDTPDVRGPGAAFASPVDVAEDAPTTDRLVALLGRSPDWRP
ncbi:TIGR03086 family metal-binding protein [Actinosynnema sp. NPDC023587]|uniref:TIGR03086 family metal-binding protein n=1 Tax=Actinosynnema sp. NPDC023587 TaxID=3154695 RepID=UPI003405FCA4